MSKYTTELRFICENYAGYNEQQGYMSIPDIIDKAIPKVFDFDFPIWDESYRKPLCTKILKHFYTREIAEETVGLWKLRLNTRLNEIMPYYNKLYEAWAEEFNLLQPMDITTDTTKEINNTANGNITEHMESTVEADGSLTIDGKVVTDRDTRNETDNIRKDIYSDTPQGGLTNLDAENYLTNARKVIDDNETDYTEDVTVESDQTNTTEDTTETETNRTLANQEISSGTETLTQRVHGNPGNKTYAQLMKEFQDAVMNVDLMVMKDLNNLFMLIW